MGPKYKVTGCARFFIFFLFFVPAVFFGAAYFRGENGVQIIKDFYHNIIGGKNSSSSRSQGSEDTLSVEELQRQLNEAREKIKDLEEKVQGQQEEIDKLKVEEK